MAQTLCLVVHHWRQHGERAVHRDLPEPSFSGGSLTP